MSDKTSLLNKIVESQPPMWVRIIVAIISAGLSSWTLTYCSVHGVNFETLGVNSEAVKAGITGTLTGFFTAPDSFAKGTTHIILVVRSTLVAWWNAIRYGKDYGQQEE